MLDSNEEKKRHCLRTTRVSKMSSYISNISSKFKSIPPSSSSSGSENNWVETPRVKAAEGAKAEAEQAIKATMETMAIFMVAIRFSLRFDGDYVVWLLNGVIGGVVAVQRATMVQAVQAHHSICVSVLSPEMSNPSTCQRYPPSLRRTYG